MSYIKVICKHKPKHVMSKAVLRLDIKTRKRVHFPVSCSYPFSSFLVLFCFVLGMEWRPCICLSWAVYPQPVSYFLFLRHSLLSGPARFELTMELAILQPQPPEQAWSQACSTRLSFHVFMWTETSHRALTVNSDCPRQGCDSEHNRQGSLCWWNL